MVYAVQTCALVGLFPYPVTCEVDLALQLPSFHLVGLAGSITQESRERIRAAVVNSGLEWPARKVTINLLPAALPKWGSHFELAMALGVLGASAENVLPLNVFAVGELSLSGEIRACGWTSAIADWLLELAVQSREKTREPLLVIVHERDARDLASALPELTNWIEFCGVQTLAEALHALGEARARLELKSKTINEQFPNKPAKFDSAPKHFSTLSQVKEEPLGVLAALTAIAGGHHCLFTGSHGMGKSMLIRAICESMPLLTEQQHSKRRALMKTFGDHMNVVSDEESHRPPIVPLQASISRAALEGALLNSGQVVPGELTRAHLGVMVVDEMLEFRRDVLEAFRQPLDEGLVRLQRAKLKTVLPAKFQLLASTNLCPCGFYGQGRGRCRCAPTVVQSYVKKLSGPLMDRFDIVVMIGQRKRFDYGIKKSLIPLDLQPVIEELLDSSSWPERIDLARELLSAPSHDYVDPVELWAELWGMQTCPLRDDTSDRGKLKLSRVSRTIAALMGEPRTLKHLRLAILLRQDPELAISAQNNKPTRGINGNHYEFRPVNNN